MATDSLIPEWLEDFEQQEQVGLAEEVENIEPTQQNIVLPGQAGQASQPRVNLPGVMTPQDEQAVSQPPPVNQAVPPSQPASPLNLPGATQPQPQQAPIDPMTGLTPEEEAELEMLMQMQEQGQLGALPNVPPTEDLEQAAQGSNEVILPDVQIVGGS